MLKRKKPPRIAEKKTRVKAEHGKAPAKGKASRLRTKRKKIVPQIMLTNWKQFADVIRRELGEREFIVRTFDLVVFDGIGTDNAVEVDLLNVARNTGNDRRENATMWNVEGFDHDHDRVPSGKKPHEIIYAFRLDVRCRPYKASKARGDNTVAMKAYDLTKGLSENNGMIVYDPSQLVQASANEHWFRTTPLKAALLILRLED